MTKRGRPRKLIDAAQVAELAGIHCTYEEIAAVMDCSTDTLKRHFAALIEKGREEGRMSLRRMQFQKALEGNNTMLIWLGKQYLGQADESRVKVGNLNELSDDQLVDIAQGKIPERD